MRQPLVLMVFAAAHRVSADYAAHALERANAGAPNKELLPLFQAAVFLDESPTPQAWSNLGVALLHQSGEAKGVAAERYGFWSLVVFELALRMDPLGLVGGNMVEMNIDLLKRKCPFVETIATRERRSYWRGNLLLTSPTSSEVALTLAQAGRACEAIPFFWVDLLHAEKEAAPTWVNLAVALNAARGYATRAPSRFAEISALSLACFERAEELYRRDGTPLGPDGLPPPIRDNLDVIAHLRQVVSADADHAKITAKARSMAANRTVWAELKVDRWKLRRVWGSSAKSSSRLEGQTRQMLLVAGLFSDAVMLARAHGWRTPQLKGSALSLIRSAIEAAGLQPVLDAVLDAASGGEDLSSAAANAAARGLADNRFASPLMTLTLGFVCLAAAKEAEAALDISRARALHREGRAAFKVSLALAPADISAKTGLERAEGEAAALEERLAAHDSSASAAKAEQGAEPSVRTDDPDAEWVGEVGGSPALIESLRALLERQRAAARWLAAEDGGNSHVPEEPPRILIGHVPNVGLGNQLIAVTSYLAHALLSQRTLFLQTATLQCDTTLTGDAGVGPTSLSPFCNVFELRHEGGAGNLATASVRTPLWHLVSVLERSRGRGRLDRLHAAYNDTLHLNARAIPGRQLAFDHFACAEDHPGGALPRLVSLKTSLYYATLLKLNHQYTDEAARLFLPATGGRASAAGHPYDQELDIFGPLFRFLLRPSAALQAEVAAFARRFFQRDPTQRRGPTPGAPLIIGVHARVQDETAHHASAKGPGAVSKLEAATKRCARLRVRVASSEVCGGACNQSVHVVAFVASDDATVRANVVKSLESLSSTHHVRVVTYSPPMSGYRKDNVAARGTTHGQFAAAADLLLLAHADGIIRAGNRGFSSLSAAAAAIQPTPPVEWLVNHPCDDEPQWKKEYDCIVNLRTQPRMLMRWPFDNSPFERSRVSCPLHDAYGNVRTLAQRMKMAGSLDQWCDDLGEMAAFNVRNPVSIKLSSIQREQPNVRSDKEEL